MGAPSTQSESHFAPGEDERPVPGALLVFSGNAPMLRAFEVAPGPVTLGRDDSMLPDTKMSRQHARFVFDGPGWTVTDLDSRNGSAVDGLPITGDARAASGSLVRLAQSLFLLVDDVRRFQAAAVSTQGAVIGPTLRAPLDRVALAARGGATVLITGENGTGKELAARTFHEAAAPKGPLVSLNCATLQKGTAERELFGAVKGAYTDLKADAEGVVQAADGGVLFLDEIGELEPDVQAKLLRFVENQEARPVGATTAKRVNVRVCAATNMNLRQRVDAGAFRRDLFYRLAQVEVRLPLLRERREEIPFLIDSVLRELPVRQAHASFVEAALLRPWPGNVRELLSQVKHSATQAHAAGSDRLRAEHLDAEAGYPTDRAMAEATAATGTKSAAISKEEIEKALQVHGGNVSATARALGIKHKTALYRLMAKHGISGSDDEP